MKFKIIITVIALTAGALALWILFTHDGNPYAAVDMISSHVRNGRITDFHNDVFNAEPTIDDVGWQQDSDGVYYIQFGKIEIKLTEEMLSDKTMLDKLKQIGIVIKRNKSNGTIRFEWNGEKMSQWVR
jgi:hypothetical protein